VGFIVSPNIDPKIGTWLVNLEKPSWAIQAAAEPRSWRSSVVAKSLSATWARAFAYVQSCLSYREDEDEHEQHAHARIPPQSDMQGYPMGRFWDFVGQSAPLSEGKLPLIHATDLLRFRDIREHGELRPADCDVYKGEKLLYFFYGRPSYRPHGQEDTITAKAFLPICLVMSRAAMNKAIRILPFDSGAFHRRMMHPPMHEEMTKDVFELMVSPESPVQAIELFYGNEKNYREVRAKPAVDGFDEFEELEVDAYFRLLHHRANTKYDDRITAVEIQLNESVPLTGYLHAVILPKSFFDRPGIAEQIGGWGR
jgi:hypothetical protein